jgi:hypothetical protein
MGVFLVDDASGRIGDRMPGERGYARAALSSAARSTLFSGRPKVGTVKRVDLPAESYLGFYLVQNGKARQFLKSGGRRRPHVFFSFKDANHDGFNHLRKLPGGHYAFEDQTRGGDRDFNDLVFRVRFDDPQGTPTLTRPPAITARLANDTARGGLTNTDRITSDPSVAGTIISSSPVSRFRAGLDATPAANFLDVGSSRRPFCLGPRLVESAGGRDVG